MKRALALCVCVLSACELQEVQIAETEDVLIAEIVLRAGDQNQHAWLHRTRAAGQDPRVDDAVVRVESESGTAAQFQRTGEEACLIPRRDTVPAGQGTCYQTLDRALEVEPGRTYRLNVTTPDGRRLTGSTTVPADFQLLRPARPCHLAAMGSFEAVWTKSPNAWVYASEISLWAGQRAFEKHGIKIDSNPLRLFGLSLSAQDTTIHIAKEFGLFDRFDEHLTEALAFLQQGVPGPTNLSGVIAAADRNYVNWERGGGFNPSGFVRVPSVHGDGTGVFGSLVPKDFEVFVDMESHLPLC
ncbi:MAG: DUF4249 family protein [Gemmatimonadota bacterium]